MSDERLDPLATTGDVASFGGRAFYAIGQVRPFADEVLRQAALIATGGVLVLMVAMFFVGVSCGQTVSDAARALGTEQFGAVQTYVCSTRQVTPFLFGYILAAKIGCGFVAELGSMRVREEVDALETMGIRTLPYLVGTRILGSTIVLPFAFWLSLASSNLGAYLMGVVRYGDVSPGSYAYYFYSFQHPSDLLFIVAQGVVLSALIVTVALYFGWRVRGGPVEVGRATARSMAVNLTLATLVNLAMTVGFLIRPQLPIA
jgi:phospholipid/cholesterol/gamma-HCH transport system permease protein